MPLYWYDKQLERVVQFHSVEILEIYSVFWQNFRESNDFTKEFTKEVI